jgi:hypothetical protein
MPTLDDAPIVEKLVGDSLLAAEVSASTKLSRSDLIQVFDVSEKKAKTITVKELADALGVTITP